jgi:hypothetical protein
MATTSIRTSTPEVTPNSRAERALALYQERGHEIEYVGFDHWRVPATRKDSSLASDFYTVLYGEHEACSCKDYQFGRGKRACKHLLAVGILHAKRRRLTVSVAGDPFVAAARSCRYAECAGCRQRFHRGELAEVQDSLTYFEGDLLCEECWHGSDAVVL